MVPSIGPSTPYRLESPRAPALTVSTAAPAIINLRLCEFIAAIGPAPAGGPIGQIVALRESVARPLGRAEIDGTARPLTRLLKGRRQRRPDARRHSRQCHA